LRNEEKFLKVYNNKLNSKLN